MTARMNREFLLSLLRHALTGAGGAVVANGSLSSDEMEQGVGALLTLAGVLWAWHDKRAKRRPAAPPEGTALVLACILPAALLLVGCGHLDADADADPVAVRAEQTISSSYNIANALVRWEEANRDQLSDDVSAAADTVRADFPPAHRAALDALQAYKADRSVYAKDQLLRWLSTLTKLDEIAQRARGEIAQP